MTLSVNVAMYKELVTKSKMFHMSWMYSWAPSSQSCFISAHIRPITTKQKHFHSYLYQNISFTIHGNLFLSL